MFWEEVYSGQRSLAFEPTTAILWLKIHNKHALGAMATMDNYASSQVVWDSHITIVAFESYLEFAYIPFLTYGSYRIYSNKRPTSN